MSGSYMLSLRDTSAYTLPTNFSAFSINWGECPEGFATVPVNWDGNNNKICVPLPDSNGRTYLSGPLPVKCSSSYRRHAKNLYGPDEFAKAPPLCLPALSQCVQRTDYLPASQSLYDRPNVPGREINFREEVGRSPACKQAPYCDSQSCPSGIQDNIATGEPTIRGDPTYDWDYLQMNDYFHAPVHRWDSNGYNAEELRAPRSIHTSVPISPKWDAYRTTLADIHQP